MRKARPFSRPRPGRTVGRKLIIGVKENEQKLTTLMEFVVRCGSLRSKFLFNILMRLILVVLFELQLNIVCKRGESVHGQTGMKHGRSSMAMNTSIPIRRTGMTQSSWRMQTEFS